MERKIRLLILGIKSKREILKGGGGVWRQISLNKFFVFKYQLYLMEQRNFLYSITNFNKQNESRLLCSNTNLNQCVRSPTSINRTKIFCVQTPTLTNKTKKNYCVRSPTSINRTKKTFCVNRTKKFLVFDHQTWINRTKKTFCVNKTKKISCVRSPTSIRQNEEDFLCSNTNFNQQNEEISCVQTPTLINRTKKTFCVQMDWGYLIFSSLTKRLPKRCKKIKKKTRKMCIREREGGGGGAEWIVFL